MHADPKFLGPLDFLPLGGIFVCLIGLALMGMESGYRLGRWRHGRRADEKDAPVGAMVGSVLALLALMLAFTFNLAASRFDDRRRTVLEEANAIGTTYLRARLLPEAERNESERMLREYVDARMEMVATRQISQGLGRSEELQAALWTQAAIAAEKSPASIMTGLYIQSLNELIDVHGKRVMVGLRSRIPLSIWGALFVLSLLGMLSMGYQAGLSATRRSPAEMLVALAFAGVLFLIVDLDRAHEGLLAVGQGAMTDLQRTMHNSSHP